MLALLEYSYEQLKQLCTKFRVRRLALYGSAATGEFDFDSSDLDCLVDFEPMATRALIPSAVSASFNELEYLGPTG